MKRRRLSKKTEEKLIESILRIIVEDDGSIREALERNKRERKRRGEKPPQRRK